jgi:hypothetical protein
VTFIGLRSDPLVAGPQLPYDEDFGFHSFVFELKCYFESFDSHGGLCCGIWNYIVFVAVRRFMNDE